jgi:hypothetical protein
VNYREADGSDKIAAFERADQIFAKLRNSPKAAHNFLSPDEAINFLFDGPGVHTYIVDETFLVSYLIVGPWSFEAGAKVVQELLIGRLYDNGGEFSSVLQFLHEEATKFACVGTISTFRSRVHAAVLGALQTRVR